VKISQTKEVMWRMMGYRVNRLETFRCGETHMTRLLTLAVLGIALVSTLTEAKAKRIHVTAKVIESTFIGDPDQPKIGDQRITNVNLFDDSGKHVGIGVGVCTLFIISPQDTLQQCLLTAAFDEEGHIIFGGITPLPQIAAVSQLGILGGTEKFRNARGDAILVITPAGDIDSTFDLELDSERRHSEFPAP
jgi:hypothetical protein